MAAKQLPSEDDRVMLRDAIRGMLEQAWQPQPHDMEAGGVGDVAEAWQSLCEQGMATLGVDEREGGLRELLIAVEELGRVACLAPMIATGVVNLAFRDVVGLEADVQDLLGELHVGSAVAAIAFSGSDRAIGSITRDGDTVSGRLALVEMADIATHLFVFDGASVAILPLRSHSGVSIVATRALGSWGNFEVNFDGASAIFVSLNRDKVADLSRVTQLLFAGRSQAGAARAFEMAVEYVKERRQFGQPVGRFQALQHKLANCMISLEGVRLLLAHAASQYDLETGNWLPAAASACSMATALLRQASLETHHSFGAIGYAEEHEAPRFFKRLHIDLLRFGGAETARETLAAWYLDGPARGLPQFDLGESGNAFREEVRRWLETHWAGGRHAEYENLPYKQREFDRGFAEMLGTTGWIGLEWGETFGGQARTPLEHIAFMEMMEVYETPRTGAPVTASMLMLYGTEEQRERYLPEILEGKVMYGMGYSEPNSGSDLASIKTRAVREGDEWVINGQKIWTTTYWGDYMILAVRTDPDASPPHAGISLILVPMDTPGITIKPAKTMYDGAFANVFYDDVRVPLSAMVGPVHGGWKVLMDALATERAVIGGSIITKLAHQFTLLCAYVREADEGTLSHNPFVRRTVGELAAQLEMGRQFMIQCASTAEHGATPLYLAAISKVFAGELMERFGEQALEILGPIATLSQDAPGAIMRGRLEQSLRHSMMWVISLGSNEIQRTLIAQRGLGLPK